MKKIIFSVGIFLVFSGPVFAQQTLVGKYSGSFELFTNRGLYSTALSLEIVSVDGDTVTGKAIRYPNELSGRSPCAGNYLVEGKVKGDTLELRATEKGGPAGDCGMTLRLTVEGNKLVGTMNKNKAELSK